MTVPYAFSAATSAIPLSQLDDNFNTTITLGNTAIQLGNTVTTLNNMTLANVTISSGNVTLTNVTVTTANATTVNTTTLIATTANVTTVNATNINVATTSILNYGTVNGVAYLNASKVLTTGSALTFDGTNFATTGGISATGATGITNTVGGNTARMISTAVATYFGSTTAADVVFQYNSAEQMRLTSTGLVVGNTSGSAKLESWYTSTAPSLSSSAGAGLSLRGTSTLRINIGSDPASPFGGWIQTSDGGGNAFPLSINPLGGNVGIGTTSPNGYGSSYTVATINNATTGAVLDLNIADVRTATFFTTTAETRLGSITNIPLSIYTNNTERARIDSSGNLLVGTTDSGPSSGQGVKLLPTGRVYSVITSSIADSYDLYNTTAAAYRFYVTSGGTINATSTTITAISDQRLKENIRDLDDGLAAVMALKPRKFDWKAGKGKDIKDDRGFIAQEFEQVFPDMIDNWKDPAPEGEEPYKAVNANLIPTLVKAIQELKAEFDAYKATHP